MKKKESRLEAIRMIISGSEVSSQDALLQALRREGFDATQATLSRDLKQLKVAKAADMNGKYIYVLPNNVMYKRANEQTTSQMLMNGGFVSLHFSQNIAVIRTRPGYASSMAYDIDSHESPLILGTVAGDDTIMLVISESSSQAEVRSFLSSIIPCLE
jgi:transcriptional regulator of arginine metabolism